MISEITLILILSIFSFWMMVTLPVEPQMDITFHNLLEHRCEKTGFLHMRKTKTQIECAVTAQLIGAFVFAIRIEQSLYYMYKIRNFKTGFLTTRLNLDLLARVVMWMT